MLALVGIALAATPASVSAAEAREREQRGLLGSALGVPCVPGPSGVRICLGTVAGRVPSWDGTPLDVDLYLPPNGGAGPHPLIVGLHGFGATKLFAFENDDQTPLQLQAIEWAKQGYVVMAYSARGIGFSCGLTDLGALLPGCQRGWIHLADARFEVRDTQHLAGLLVDAGLVDPQRIGVTGASYGGGQSLMLATLRDRMMLPDGRLVPWTSPSGVPMRIAAAAPRIGWSDLAYALVPNGRKLDFRARNPYGHKPGVVKKSYLGPLLFAGETGYYAPQGADPEADIHRWKAFLDAGEPYDRAEIDHILGLFARYRSPYSVQDTLPRRKRKPPAPTVIYNAWTDDIMPPEQALAYYNRAKQRFGRRARLGLIFADEFAHDRGSLVRSPNIANDERDTLFARYLMGDQASDPLRGVITKTQGCHGQPERGPFRTATWHGQHPGEVRLRGGPSQSFDSSGGNAANSHATDPLAYDVVLAQGACRTVDATTDPGAATYQMAPVEGRGFTLLGSPTISARLRVRGRFPQIIGRLWDVGPDGRQTLVQHSIYRPRPRGLQTFQLTASGWHFAAGHRAKLELLGRDEPYAQASNGRFEIIVRDLVLELPVRQRPDGARIKRFAPPKD